MSQFGVWVWAVGGGGLTISTSAHLVFRALLYQVVEASGSEHGAASGSAVSGQDPALPRLCARASSGAEPRSLLAHHQLCPPHARSRLLLPQPRPALRLRRPPKLVDNRDDDDDDVQRQSGGGRRRGEDDRERITAVFVDGPSDRRGRQFFLGDEFSRRLVAW